MLLRSFCLLNGERAGAPRSSNIIKAYLVEEALKEKSGSILLESIPGVNKELYQSTKAIQI
jgi:hypothetical protein